jgi:acetyltransferase
MPAEPSRRPPEVLDRWHTPAGLELVIRPMASDDAARELRFLESLSEQTRYERFFSHRGELQPGELRQLVRYDVRREIALLTASGSGADEQIVAVARLKKGEDSCEFALVVGDAWRRQGIGARLLGRLLAEAQRAGVRQVFGVTLSSNTPMKALCRGLGFTMRTDPDDATVTLMERDLAVSR